MQIPDDEQPNDGQRNGDEPDAARSSTNSTSAVALIPAAGLGSRLGKGPKAFLTLHGKSLLRRAAEAVQRFVDRVLVGVEASQLDRAVDEVGDIATAIEGGTTRLETIAALFAHSSEDICLVHDAARPFATPELIEEVLLAAREHGAALATSSTRVPVARVVDGFVEASIDRAVSYLGETPQAFSREVLARCLRHASDRGLAGHSPWELVAELGLPMRAITHDTPNPKITSELDWAIAEKVLAPLNDAARTACR